MGRERALQYQPGIDGLRALAVVAVILYHAQQSMPSSWIPGGFLGVEVFFVISGYLITALIVAEHGRTGRLDIVQFWVRRARRLLPALIALLVVTMAVVGLVGRRSDSLREHVGAFRGTWLSAWGYVTNWYQIAAGLNYGDNIGRPPLLRHLWSLAVEEQFYVVWPLVMWAVLVRGHRRLRVAGITFGLLAVVIALVMALAYRPDDVGRINVLYLSTPTRAGGLLLGAALAIFWQPRTSYGDWTARSARSIDAAAIVALAVLGWAVVRWHLTTEGAFGARGYDLLFRGGFLIIGVATLVVIVAATHAGSFVGQRVLGHPALVWVGKRSYGLYLWHWPVFQLMRPTGDLSLLDVTQPDVRLAWLPTLALRLLITVAITEVSYRFIELPIRRRGFVACWRAVFGRGAHLRRVGSAATGATVVAVVGVVVFSSVATFDAVDELAVAAACNADPASCGEPVGEPPPEGPVVESVSDSVAGSTVAAGAATSVATTTGGSTPASSAPAPVSSVTTTTLRPRSTLAPLILGDSVVVGASLPLRRAGIRVDAQVNRGFAGAVGIVRDYQRRSQLGDLVIIALGTSGGVKEDYVEPLMDLLSSVRNVVFVTPNTAGRQGGRVSREVLLATAERYPNVSIVDWWEISAEYRWFSEGNKKVAFEDLYFYRDRIHLVSKGRRLFADVIIDEVGRLLSE